MVNFEYYELNYSFNDKKVKMYNIFNNYYVNERTEKAIKKYLRSPKNYKHIKQYANEFLDREEIAIYGFEGLCEEIRRIIMCEEWARCEYEIGVGDIFIIEVRDILRDFDKYNSLEELKEDLEKENKRCSKLEKWDCYSQALPNIEMITRECIYQYKKYLKEQK